jgi:hypothetical protein
VSVEQLTARALVELESDRKQHAQEVEQETARAESRQRRRQLATARALALAGLPDEAAEGRVVRYETHLNRCLFTTFRELELLQERRLGRPAGGDR